MNADDRIQSAIDQLSDEVAALRHQLEEERRKNEENQKEWETFFLTAHLKNPITGELITSRQDFYNFIKQKERFRQNEQRPIANQPLESQPSKKSRNSTDKNSSVFLIATSLTVTLLLLIGIYLSGKAHPVSGDTSLTNQAVGAQADSSSLFVGSVNSDFVHWRTCRYAQNISEKNRIYYDSISDALADGRQRCSECLPTENEDKSEPSEFSYSPSASQ